MAMTQEEVYTQIKDVLEDALGVDEDKVTPQATLVGDLGAESIDFLDIVFRLEKAFDIKIAQSELFPDSVLNDPQYVADGKITDAGMAELTSRLPHADLSALDQGRDVDAFSNVFTVDTITKFVASKLS
jgi:acyl carrier protein